MLAALGARYGRDDSISFVDVGIYGTWGEWHMLGVQYPGPNGEQPITAGNARKIIDWHAAEHIVNHHVAMLGSGNLTFRNYRDPDRAPAELQRAGKLLGYRLALKAVSLPRDVPHNALATMASAWKNVGVTPAYNPWLVTGQLRDAGGAVVLEFPSCLQLTKLLPTRGVPKLVVDQFAVPSRLAPGRYTVTLTIADSTGVRKPLALAVEDRAPDGSYAVGTLHVTPSELPASAIAAATAQIQDHLEHEDARQAKDVEAYTDGPAVVLSEGTPAQGVYEYPVVGDAQMVYAKNRIGDLGAVTLVAREHRQPEKHARLIIRTATP